MARMIAFTVALSIMVLAANDVAAQPFSVGARAGRAAGTLVIDADEIAFRSETPEDGRQWPYAAIRVLRIDAPNRLTIETYEARRWLVLKHGHQRVTYTIAGEGLPSEVVEFLLHRVARPMVTRVLPSPLERPLWSLQVRHERRGDDAPGTLELYADGVAFRGARPADTRFWRFRDLASVLPLDPFRIEITAREADGLKPFTFQLAQELPAGFRDAVWARINAPAKTPVEALQPPTVADVRR
ncbi:MAG TPA: hypothetical protein VF653_03175 [Methylomirabilota bacterium]